MSKTRNLPSWRRQRLKSHGRCFKCYQKGHRSAECSRPLGSPGLAQLPVELLDEICYHLVYPFGKCLGLSSTWRMMNLRLTCREINARTYDFFTEAAFHTVVVDLSYKNLQKLGDLSKSEPCVSRIKQLLLSNNDKEMGNEEYEELQTRLSTESLSRSERRQITSCLRRANREQTDKAFIARGADGIMLTMALQKMSNLETVIIAPQEETEARWPIRRKQSSTVPTTTHLFSMAVSSLAFSGIKPHVLRISSIGYGWHEQGVSIQALSMPRQMLSCVSELRELNIALETNDTSYKNPDTWHLYASTFLRNTPLLTRLTLSFSDQDWKDTTFVFGAIAKKTVLPCLQTLTFNGMRCAGVDLLLFLKNHNHLDRVALRNLDIEGDLFANILYQLSNFGCLTYFSCSQIAQDGFRTAFASLGTIEMSKSDGRFKDEPLEAFGGFQWVTVRRYTATAEHWEGVQHKMRLLSQDVTITSRTYKPDFDIEGYLWLDV